MAASNPTALLDRISAEVSANPALVSVAGPAIAGKVGSIRTHMLARDGLDPAAIRSSASPLAAGLGRGGRNPSSAQKGGGWELSDFADFFGIGLGVGELFENYLPGLMELIGAGEPSKKERELEKDLSEYCRMLDSLTDTMDEGGLSIEDILRSTDLSSNMFLTLVLRLIKAARIATPLGVLMIIAELIMHALDNTDAINGDANECLREILDRLGQECDAVADQPLPEPVKDYGPKGGPGEVVAPRPPAPGLPVPPVGPMSPMPHSELAQPEPSQPAPNQPEPTSPLPPVASPPPPIAPEAPAPSSVTETHPAAQALVDAVTAAPAAPEHSAMREPYVGLGADLGTPAIPPTTTASTNGVTVNVYGDVHIAAEGDTGLAPVWVEEAALPPEDVIDAGSVEEPVSITTPEALLGENTFSFPDTVDTQAIAGMMSGTFAQQGCAPLVGLAIALQELLLTENPEVFPEVAESPDEWDAPHPVPATNSDVIQPPSHLAEVEEPPAPPKKDPDMLEPTAPEVFQRPEMTTPPVHEIPAAGPVDGPEVAEGEGQPNDAPVQSVRRARKVEGF